MTQRIFDIENQKDMADLWDILPDEAYSIKKSMGCQIWRRKGEDTGYYFEFVKINWHNKTEITRPIQEATEAEQREVLKDKPIRFVTEVALEMAKRLHKIGEELDLECKDE